MPLTTPSIQVRGLTMAFGEEPLMRDLNFQVRRGSVFIVMGGSGCGKSTLLRHLTGLMEPAEGEIYYGDFNFTQAAPRERRARLRKAGVLFQQGALWSSMTLSENIAVPLEEYTSFASAEIRELAAYKLSLVGLKGFEDYYPSEISGGMRKRAALARAMALDPEMLFLDEPSAGLDPLTSKQLDDLILRLRDSLGTTFIVVTHELASLMAIGDDSVFLDRATRTQIARGRPRELAASCPNETVRRFLSRDFEARE